MLDLYSESNCKITQCNIPQVDLALALFTAIEVISLLLPHTNFALALMSCTYSDIS